MYTINYTSVSSTRLRTQQNYFTLSSKPEYNNIFTLQLAAHQYLTIYLHFI